MVPSLSVVTCSPVQLWPWLSGCIQSVRAQTVGPVYHLFAVEDDQTSAAVICNTLIESVPTEWVMILGADQRLVPDFVEQLLPMMSEHDVILPWWWQASSIPGGRLLLFRVEAFRDAGGWDLEGGSPDRQDEDLIRRMEGLNVRFGYAWNAFPLNPLG